MATHSSPRLLPALGLLASAASLTAILVGSLVLVGWQLDLETLKTVLPGLPGMVPNTALAFILAGLALWLLRTERASPRARRVGQMCALVVALVGLLTLSEYLFGWDLGIDQLLFRGPAEAAGRWAPGRASPTGALNLVLVGLALLALSLETRRGYRAAQLLALAATLTPLAALVGYAYGARYLYGPPALLPYMGMALHTALTFLGLCLGLLAARPERGLMAIFTSESLGGVMARRLFLAVVGLPLALGLLTLAGVHAELYDVSLGFVAFAVTDLAILAAVVGTTAHAVHRADVERGRAEEAERELRARLEVVSQAGLAIADTLATDGQIELPALLQNVVEQARAVAGARYAALGIGVDPERPFEPWVQSGLSSEEAAAIGRTPRPVGLLGAVVREGRTLRLRELQRDPLFRGFPPGHPAIANFLGVPIRFRGRAVGYLYLGDKVGAEEFSKADQRAVELLADYGGTALEHARIHDQLVREVAERKRTEEALRESEARYRTLVEMAPDVIYSIAADRTFTMLSPAFETITGWRVEDWLGKSFTGLVHPEDLPLAVATFEQALRGETPPPYELRVRSWAGEYLVGEFRSAPQLEHGHVVGECGIARDVTERKRAEEGLRFLSDASKVLAISLDYEATLQSVARLAVPTLADLCVVDLREDEALRQVAVAHVDPAKQALLGELWRRYPPDPHGPHPMMRALLTGRSELLPEVPDALLEAFARDAEELAMLREFGARSGIVVPLVVRGRTLGVLAFVVAQSGRRYDADDLALAEELAHRCAVAIDNAQLYRQTLAVHAEAEAQRARVQAVLQSAAQAILFVEAESGRIIANPVAIQLLGRPLVPEAGRAQLVGQVLRPDGQPLPLEELPSSRALQGATVQDEELLMLRPDGRYTPVLATAAPVRDASGKVTGVVVTFQDISALKELERLREEWTSVIAHDLRQPVTVITGYAGLLARLMERHPGVPQEQKIVEHIHTSARQLNRMIADLLDVSRLEAGRLALERQALDLPALVCDVVERTAEVTRGHPVQVELMGDVPPIEADPQRVEQVLGNLLSNAAKYGETDTEIRVALAPRDGAVEVAVTNRGPGIPPEDLPRIFTRFYRARQARAERVAGLGLGLYISKGLVEAHGGRLWAESTPGQTTTFHFTLPAAAHQGRSSQRAA